MVVQPRRFCMNYTIETYSQYTADAISLLQRLITVPRTSRNEAAAADLLAAEMDVYGMAYHREGNNIWTISDDYNADMPTLLLNAHIDTVKPTPSWTCNPYEPKISDGKLIGLGSNDCGGGLTTLLQVFRLLNKQPRHFNVVYLASAEEEVSGQNGIVLALPLLPKIDVAIVGEPTGMQPAVAEKGLMVLDITAHGQSGHAARGGGINAIYEAMDDIRRLREYRFERVSEFLGETRVTVTMINSGTQHNVIPDSCTMVADVRTNELYTNEEVFGIVSKLLKSEVKARSFRLHSSSIPTDHPLVRQCLNMGLSPFGSPTLSDQALMPFPSLKIGPGKSERSHSADEFILIKELEEAIPTYMKLLDGITI